MEWNRLVRTALAFGIVLTMVISSLPPLTASEVVKAGSSPWPSLGWFKVDGNEIGILGTAAVGPSTDIWVESRWSNTGDDNSRHGGITMSFPDCAHYNDLGIDLASDFEYDGGTPDQRQKDDDIATLWGWKENGASHIMFEGDDTEWDRNDGPFSESHTIKVRIHTPSSSTTIKVCVRGSMADEYWNNVIRNPSSGSSNGDQQGWPTFCYYIRADADGLEAPDNVWMHSGYDTGYQNGDGITSNRRPKFWRDVPTDYSNINQYYWQIYTSGGSFEQSDYTSPTNDIPNSDLADGNYKIQCRLKTNLATGVHGLTTATSRLIQSDPRRHRSKMIGGILGIC